MKFATLLCGLFSLAVAYPHPEGKEGRGQIFCHSQGCWCDNGKIINTSEKKCDGNDDCGDNSDEQNCGSCFSAGTMVTLACGEEIAIEKQKAGLNVISNAGDITTITSEYVENDIGAGGQLFGINDGNPFATPNHPFWTTEGWKSLNPEAAFEENPQIAYGVLQIGDTLFHIVQTTPLLYEPIEISQLTFTTLSEPSKTYGLHLNGPQSYHANGFVVGANYPILTEKRLQDGMKKLGSGEMKSLKVAIGSHKGVTKLAGKWAKRVFLDVGPVDLKSVGDN